MDSQTIVVKSYLDEPLRGRSLSTMADGTGAESTLRARVGRAVAARRAELGLSQQGLAARARVSRTFVSSIETGSQAPSFVVLSQVAAALRTTTGALLGETSAPAAPPDSRLSPARDRVGRLRQEVEALHRLLAPEDEPFEAGPPRIVSLEEVGRRRKKATEPVPENLVRLPIVGERLAAGMGSWPERPDDEFRWVTFREDWTGLSYPKDHTRYVLAKLGDESVADSMAPDILPGSLVLLDYSDGARVEVDDGKPYLCVVRDGADEPELAVKYVERIYVGAEVRRLRLISGNKEKYDPFEVQLEAGQPIQHVVRARVVWWATTVE